VCFSYGIKQEVIRVTEKQKRFCEEYLIDLNATQAALRAGYSEKTAYSIGNENLHKPEIQEYIQKRLKEKEDALIAKQDEVLKTLTAVMRREKPETVVVTCKARKSHYDDKGKKVTDEAEQPICVEIPTKVSDVNKAAEMLGKYYALFTEKLNVDGDMDYSIKIDYGGGDE
jgi:phage terminase small subunit